MGEHAILGICATGFFFLAGWCWYLNTKMGAVLETTRKVNEIHEALLGDMNTEGILSKFRRQQDSCLIHKALKGSPELVKSLTA